MIIIQNNPLEADKNNLWTVHLLPLKYICKAWSLEVEQKYWEKWTDHNNWQSK